MKCLKASICLTVMLLQLTLIKEASSVRCYQCSSADNKKEDTCGAYKKFEKARHIAVECNSEESHMPGSFCMKLTKQGPRGFIWDGRWRQVVRRCASVADTGVTGVCNWGVDDNGDYWEECYCSADECNSSNLLTTNWFMIFFTSLVASYLHIVFNR